MHARVLAAAWLWAAPVAAQQAGPVNVVSSGPASVAVMIYRAPGRAPEAPLSQSWLGGYALISEERDIDLPAGAAILRFEGVAAGMLAESAILTGLPDGVTEKNLDADLLSPRNLYARAFGRPVTLRRLHPGSGQVEEEPAIIRSGPDGAAVVQTRAGFELVNCGGVKDSIAYQGLPQGLNSRPTLSVATRSATARRVRVRVRLSYLAWGFDWRAHYVLALAPGAREGRLTAWLTLASSDDTGFPAAAASVIAGQPHFDENRPDEQGGDLELRCGVMAPAVAAPPPLSMAAPMAEIVLTASRRMMKADVVAQAERLGDLHLYRIPVPTTVAAHAQKQVALLTARRVKLALIYAATIPPDGEEQARTTLRLRNRREDGLGLALPGGGLSVTQALGAATLPVGEGSMADKAEGETADVALDTAPTVRVTSVATAARGGLRRVRLTVANANRWPVRFEGGLLPDEGEAVVASSLGLGRKDGRPLWSAVVPARGTAVLTYSLRRTRP